MAIFLVTNLNGGINMSKKLLSVLAICSFVISLSTDLLASQQPSKQEVLETLLIKMRLDLQGADNSGDPPLVTQGTLDLLDNLQLALKNNDPEFLKAVINKYAAGIKIIPAQELDPTCGPSLLFGLFNGTVSLINAVRGGGDTTCLIVNITSIVADIVSDIQTYKICVIDNSTDPDEIARQQIVQRQVIVETYDFITAAYDLFFCTLAPAPLDYLNLLLEFLDIFPEPPDKGETPAVIH
jgi:hypothetical protein